MKLTISEEALKQHELTLKDLGLLLFYAGGGTGNLDSESGDKLWNMNLLTKTLDGYEFNYHTLRRLEEWFSEKEAPKKKKDEQRFIDLAEKLRELYPKGCKPNTQYPWRDNTMAIARRLEALCEKFQCSFTDEEAVEATRKYIDSFGGNYRYMQLLKYFILKRDNEKMEENSQLLNFIQNKELAVQGDIFRDNGDII